MKIAYVYYLLRPNQFGIERKIRQQGQAISAAELEELEIIVLNPSSDRSESRVKYVKSRSSRPPLDYLDHIFRRYQIIDRSLDLRSYDYVILRYPLADKSGIEFTRKAKVITEHNTVETSEIRARLATSKSPVERLARLLLLQKENRYGPLLLRQCQGLIAVTGEIKAAEQQRIQKPIPARTIANGINVENIRYGGFKRFDGKNLDIVLVASDLRPWHGLERVATSFKRYPGTIRLKLHVVGNIIREELPQDLQKMNNIQFHGPLTGDEIGALIPRMNLAVSTMALHRKNMNEACSLKTREYVARGIPFIIAYEDPDLRSVDSNARFFLTFPNDDSLIDVGQVVEFAGQVSRNREDLSEYMRTYALQHLDWRVKLREYVDFVKQISSEVTHDPVT